MAGLSGRRSATRDAGRSGPVFAYGTLMFAEVVASVTGLAIAGRSARIEDFARFRVRGAVYPGIRPSVGDGVQGVLYPEVSARSLRLLDLFEGDLYRREALQVMARDGSIVTAHAWIVRPSQIRRLSDRPWDPELFRRRHLSRYLDRIGRFPARAATRRHLWSPGV